LVVGSRLAREGSPRVVERECRCRWVICLLLFLATTVNYIDRQILALVKAFLGR
jgi:ACS family hexuronate transporter-like MFS transporter